MDQQVTRYADFAALRGYCRLSAEPVGRLVLALWDLDDERRVALSDDVCTGLQIAEHLQDVGEDLAAGRIYLPQDALARHGVTRGAAARRGSGSQLARPSGPRVESLLADVAERARILLAAGAAADPAHPGHAADRGGRIHRGRPGGAGCRPGRGRRCGHVTPRPTKRRVAVAHRPHADGGRNSWLSRATVTRSSSSAAAWPGLSAALDLAEAGRRVTLLEARPRLGGATASFTRDGVTIDTGQHVFLRCCTAYRGFLRASRRRAPDRAAAAARRGGPARRRVRRAHGSPATQPLPAAAAAASGRRAAALRRDAARRSGCAACRPSWRSPGSTSKTRPSTPDRSATGSTRTASAG